ncbi:MAG: hypothetical protein PF904_04740 [Kiritimatiellae bacterium]|jgi:hypothetical protein|nr:hypothetical protein [Kiritimatiellia bacterium]
MKFSTIYRNTAGAFIGIGLVSLLTLWLGGWSIAVFMRHAFEFYENPLRCSFPLGDIRFPFWPIASLFVLIMHGVFMFRYSSLSASLGVPQRWWEGRSGGYDANFDNPFAKVIAKDFIVVSSLLVVFLLLCSFHNHFQWCWWGC